ncbi:MAG TPA: GNAT family N-acetyltransferase [Pyrinomonadaceae bacterium]|jgi:phosphinothricin acetyltransferase|nr:GNAT family N-acetyltransferase [Pyrinomonadaceae bacterium]
MGFLIEEMTEADWEQVLRIYQEGMATGVATFETESPAWEKWNAGHLLHSRLVARSDDDDDAVKGWAALSPVSSRDVYGGVAETSIYVGREHRGQGVGRALLEALVSSSERNGVWTLQAGIFPENAASVALHKRCGFREVGRRERIGRIRTVWRDTLLLERRSRVVGVD